MSQKQGVKIHPTLSALLLPILVPVALVAAPLSIPFSKLSQRRMRQREEVFRAQMRASNRIIEWADFAKALEEDLGTAIEERYSLKGPVRWWWISENIREHSPHPFSDWYSMLEDAKFAPFAKWCNERYIHPETGSALLVCPPEKTDPKMLTAEITNLKSKSNRWMDAVPPEVLSQKEKSPPGKIPNS